MGRYCSDCEDWCERNDFSRNQWIKGNGVSRCKSCVGGHSNNGYSTVYICHECSRQFDSQDNLNMHMQVHRPRNVACPVCGEERFRSGANAVQHVESGYCTGCRGQDKARETIYNYARGQGRMREFMGNAPMLTNGGHSDGVPDFPYRCPQCTTSFRQLSQLLQHQDQKHNNRNMIGY